MNSSRLKTIAPAIPQNYPSLAGAPGGFQIHDIIRGPRLVHLYIITTSPSIFCLLSPSTKYQALTVTNTRSFKHYSGNMSSPVNNSTLLDLTADANEDIINIEPASPSRPASVAGSDDSDTAAGSATQDEETAGAIVVPYTGPDGYVSFVSPTSLVLSLQLLALVLCLTSASQGLRSRHLSLRLH